MIRKALYILITLMLISCSGKSKEELYKKGVEELKKGNPNGAIVLLKNALEKDQNYFDARYQLALAYLDSDRLEQAEREFQKVFHQDPTKTEIRLMLGKVFVMEGKADDALKVLDEYLAQKPGDASGLQYKGAAYSLKKQYAEAERYLLQAIQADPKLFPARLELATVYATSGRNDDSRKQIDQVLADDPNNVKAYYLLAKLESLHGNKAKALDIYNKIGEISKNDPLPFYKMGMIYLDEGDIAKAELVAANLSQKFPKSGESARLTGIIQFKKKNFNEAIAALQNSIKQQPTIEGYYYLGLTLYSTGQLESAINQFRTILDHVPSYTRSRLMIGMILLQQKRVEDAISEIGKVIETDPQNALAHNLLGSAYLARGQFDEGMKELNRATALDPKLVEAHVKKGLLYLSKGKEREGEAELQTAVKVNPEILNTRLMLFSYYLRQNKPAKALELLGQGLTGKASDAPLYNAMALAANAQHNPDEALQYLRKAKTSDPSYFPTYFNIANYYLIVGQQDKAIAEYNAVLSKDPQNLKALLSIAALNELKGQDAQALQTYIAAEKTKNEAAFLALAGYYARKKEIGKAIDVLDEAIKTNSKNFVALEAKGNLLVADKKFKEALKVFDDIEQAKQGTGIGLKIKTYMAMKDFPRALEQAQQIITLKPNSAIGYMVLATIYETQNDVARAIDQLQRGIKADPGNPEARLQLGNLFAKKKDYTSAMGVFNEIVKSNSQFAPAYFAMGTVLERIGKQKEAVRKYRDALAKSENYVPALNNLSYLSADGYGDKREALRLAITAFRLEPGNPGVMDTLGYALLKNGKSAEAVKLFERAAAALPNNPMVLYHYALALKEQGDRAKAGEKLQKALEQGDFPEAPQARKLQAEIAQSTEGRKAR